MENKNLSEVVKKANSKRNRKRWLALLSAVVLFVTTNRLVMPASTLERDVPGGAIYVEEIVDAAEGIALPVDEEVPVEDVEAELTAEPGEDAAEPGTEEDSQSYDDAALEPEDAVAPEREEAVGETTLELTDLEDALEPEEIDESFEVEDTPASSGDLDDFVDDALLLTEDGDDAWRVRPGELYILRLSFAEREDLSFDPQALRYTLPDGVTAMADSGETDGVYGSYEVEDGKALTAACAFDGESAFSLDLLVSFDRDGEIDFGGEVVREVVFVEPEPEETPEDTETAPDAELVEEEAEPVAEIEEQPAVEDAEPVEEPAEQPEEDQEEQPVEEDAGEAPLSIEEAVQPEEAAKDTEPTEESEPVEAEPAAETLTEEAETEDAAIVKTADIDVGALDVPYSLNWLMRQAEPELEAEETVPVDAETEAVEEAGIEPAEEEAPAEPVPDEEPAAEPVITYDEALFEIVKGEDDYWITPLADFETAAITVEAGDIYVLNLTRAAREAAEEIIAYPAQSFEAHVEGMSVYVTAEEGAFPEGTTMDVAPVYDEAVLDGIAGSVEAEGTEVRHVQAVDITFRDAGGAEVEPLLPISVVMRADAVTQAQDAVVVHMDDDGNAEIVEQADAAAVSDIDADAMVAFDAEAFSVYALVVTQRYISADGQSWGIQVRYDSNAGIPDGATLAVREVEGPEYQEYLDQTADALSGRSISAARFFDISIMDGDTEIQPRTPVEVRITMEQGEGDVQAVHFGEDLELIEEVRQDGESVAFEAEGFSVYGVVYTVDFDYNGYAFSMPGGSRIWLTALMKALHADFTIDEVRDVRFSDPELIRIVPTEDEDNWLLISLKPFDTDETLTITLEGGRQVVILVTDAPGGNPGDTDLSGFLTYVEITTQDGQTIGSSDGDQAKVYRSQEYEIYLSFAEDEYGEQFPDTGTMYFYLPKGVDLPGGGETFETTIDIDLGRGHTLRDNPVVFHRSVTNEGGTVTPAWIEVRWNETSPEYERLTFSPRASFKLHYSFKINTDYDTLEFSDTVSVPITENPDFDLAINKSLDEDDGHVGYDPATGTASYRLEVRATGNAKDIDVTDTLGAALDYVRAGDGSVAVNVEYKNHNGGEASRQYDKENWSFKPTEDPDKSMVVHLEELADGDVAIITYKATVDYSKLTRQTAIKAETTNSAVATALEVETEPTEVDLESYIEYLSIQKKTGSIDTSHENEADPYWLVPYTIVYNHERKVPVVDAVIEDIIDTGDIHAASFDETHPVEINVYKGGTFTMPETGNDNWTFAGSDLVTTWTYNFSTEGQNSEPSEGAEGQTVPGTIHVTPSSVSDDLTDTPTSWTWTVPKYEDEAKGITATTPLIYEITYYTKVSLSMVDAGLVGNKTTEDKSGDESHAGHYVGHKEGTGLSVNKVALETNDDGTKVESAYTRWRITFDRAAYATIRAVIEDTLPKSADGKYADTYFEDDTHKTVITGLYDDESYNINSTDNGRVIFTFYKSKTQTDAYRGLKGASDDAHRTITITYYTKNNEKWMEETAKGNEEQEHINKVRFIQDVKQAWNRATATPKEPKLIKTADFAGTVHNRETGIDQPVYRYTLKLVGLNDSMFNASTHQLTITDEFDPYFTYVDAADLRGDLSNTRGTKTVDGEEVELANYGFTGDMEPTDEKLHQTVPTGETATVTVGIASSETKNEDNKKTITFTVDQYNGEGSHAADWNPWRTKTTGEDGETTYEGAPSYGFAYELSYYLMITAEDMQALADEKYEEDEGIPDPTQRKGEVTLKNKAHVTTGAELLQSDNIPVVINVRPVNKTRVEDPNSDLATYTLTINEQKLKLNNGEPYFVTDAFENLAVDYATINYVTDPADAREKITHTYTGNLGTFMVPDQTKVVITYKAWPVGKKGDTVEAKNTVTVRGYASVVDKRVTLSADTEGSAESYGVRVLKYSNDDMHKPLGGAVFQLLKLDENGNKVPVLYDQFSHKDSPAEWGDYEGKYKASDYVAGGSQDPANYPTPQNHEIGDPVFFITSDRNTSIADGEKDESWGIAEIMLSKARDGVALSKGVRYYLREVETPEDHIKENTDWTFIIADNDDFDNYIYSNDSVLKISNPTTDNDVVVEKDFYDHTGTVTKNDMYATTFEIVGKDNDGKVVYKKTMTYGNFKVVDIPQGDSYVRKYQMIVEAGELPTGHYTVTESNYPLPDDNTTLETELKDPPTGVTFDEETKVATFEWTKGTSQGPLNIHFVNTYDDAVNTKLDVKVKKAWAGEWGTIPDISTVSFDLYRTTDPSVKTLTTPAALRDFVNTNNLLPVESNVKFGTTEGSEYVKTIEKADRMTEDGADLYYYFVLERAVAGYEDQYQDSYAYATEAKEEGESDDQVITITNTHTTPTTSFTFGKLWAGPDAAKHLDTLVWPDGKEITVVVHRRVDNGKRNGAVDGSFAYTYTISKGADDKPMVSASTPEGAPAMTVLDSGNYSHYQFRLDGLEKYNAENVKWQYFVTEQQPLTSTTGVAFAAPKYGYVDGIITAVTEWDDAASREAEAGKVTIVESAINRAKPSVDIEIPVEKVIDGNVLNKADYDGKFSFELLKLAKVTNAAGKTERKKAHVAYVKNTEGAKFTDFLDLTDGLTYHARKKNAEGVYEDHPYFEGTYTYYVREVQPGERNAEPAEGETTVPDEKKQQAVDGVTFSKAEVTIEYKVDFEWESGIIYITRTIKYSDGTQGREDEFEIRTTADKAADDNKVQFTNKYDEGKRPLTLYKLWDDDGNRDGMRGNVKFRVRAEADTGAKTLKWPWEEVEGETQTGDDGYLYQEIVMEVGAKDTSARTQTKDTLPVYIDSYPVTRYYIEEVEMPTGYSKVSSSASRWVVNASEDVDENGKFKPATIEFTAENRHENKEITSVVLTKTWSDDSNRDNYRPTIDQYKGMVYLYAEELGVIEVDMSNTDCATVVDNGDNTYTVTIMKGKFTHQRLNTTTNEYVEYTDEEPISLPKYYNQGTPIVYTVIEKPIDHYTASGSGTVTVGSENRAKAVGTDTNSDPMTRTLTNTHPVDRTVGINLTKTWDDGQNQDGIRPSRGRNDDYRDFVTLYADDVPVFQDGAWVTSNDDFVKDVVNNRTGKADVTLTGKDEKTTPYEVSFANLPTYRKGAVGQEIVYRLEEKSISGYRLMSSTGEDKTYAMTNKRTPDTVWVQATKNWEEHGKDAPNYSVTLRLVVKTAEGDTPVDLSGTGYESAAADQNLTTKGQVATWTGLPKYAPNEEGVLLAYTVEEVVDSAKNITVPDGYHMVVTSRTLDASGNTTIVVTNEYEETEVTATKQWDDDKNRDGKRQQVTFQLWRQIGDGEWEKVPTTGGGYETKNIDVDSSKVTQPVTWSELPAWIGNERVQYDVKEVPLPSADYDYDDKGDPNAITQTQKPAVKGAELSNDELVDWQYTAAKTIKNTHTLETKSLSFKKRWDRHGYPDLPAYEDFIKALRLYASVEGVLEEVPSDSDSIAGEWKKNVNIEKTGDNYEVTITGLPSYRTGKVGKAITYYVSEDTVEHTSGTVTDKYTDTEHYTVSGNEETKVNATPMRVGEGEILENIHDTGSLKITKNVDSDLASDSDKVFTFNVETTPAINGTYDLSYDGGNSDVTDHQKTQVEFTDGKATKIIKLIDGETITVSGLPTGVTYTVTEDPENNFQTPDIAYEDGKRLLEAKGDMVKATVTNTRELGNLTISKAVKSTVQEDKSREYWFKIVLDALADGNKKFGDVQFTDNVAYVSVKEDAPVTITGLPTDIKYTVTEVSEKNGTPIDGEAAYLEKFDKGSTGDTGSLAKNGNTAAFTNTRKTGNLEITKTLENFIEDDAEDIFYFDVVLTGDDDKPLVLDDDNAPITVGDTRLTATEPTEGKDHSLYYKNGKIYNVPVNGHKGVTGKGTTVISGLPEGTTYTVTEESWVAVASKDNIKQVATGTQGDRGTIEAPGKKTADFTNERLLNAQLDITKRVEDSPVKAERDAVYTIVVTLTNTKGKTLVTDIDARLWRVDPEDQNGAFKEDKTLKFANGSETITIRKDETVQIKNLPTDVTYTITELNADQFDKTLEIMGEQGFVKASGLSGDILSPAEIETRLTNTRQLGDLTIGKTVSSPVTADHGSDKYYWFKVEASGYTIDNGMYTENGVVLDPESPTYTAADLGLIFTNNVAYVRLKDTENITAHGLPVGLTYTVTEIKDEDTFNAITTTITSGFTFDEDYLAKFNTEWKKTVAGDTGATRTGTGAVFTDTAHAFDKITEAASDVRFTNTRKTGSLQLTKTVVSPFRTEREQDYYPLMVTMTVGDAATSGTYAVSPAIPVVGENGITADKTKTVTFDDEGKATIYVNGAQPVTISGLPIDAVCAVIETQSPEQAATFEPTVTYKADVTASGDPADDPATIAENKTSGATVTNTRKAQPISLRKVSTADSVGTGYVDKGLSGAEFTLTQEGADWTVVLESGEGGVFRVQGHTGELPADLIATANEALVTLPVSDYDYLLTETRTPDGYNTLEWPVVVHVTASDVTYKAYFGVQDDKHIWSHILDGNGKTIQDADINLLIPNSPGVVLPSTGGEGTLPYTVLGSTLVLLALALILRRRRGI